MCMLICLLYCISNHPINRAFPLNTLFWLIKERTFMKMHGCDKSDGNVCWTWKRIDISWQLVYIYMWLWYWYNFTYNVGFPSFWIPRGKDTNISYDYFQLHLILSVGFLNVYQCRSTFVIFHMVLLSKVA